MGPKVLFIAGIIAAHGALAAGWARQDAPRHRTSIATCIQAPEELPFFEAPRELLARVDMPGAELKVTQP
jgi:hypothetical protein